MKNPDEESKFIGCILGVAAGDSLGSFFEGSFHVDPEEVERTAELNRFSYSDDTHMTIGVAESLIQSKGFEGQHMANTFIKNYELEPYGGYGLGPPNVFKMMKQGMPWKELDKLLYPGGLFGNGSAMRVAPIELLYHRHLRIK
jgi:poly(ADP-ribose) glycohydrolase ARH3